MTRAHRSGFSLISLLVLMAVLGFVIGFLMVAVGKTRMAASRINSVNNLKQLALGAHVYADANNSDFPAGNDKNNYSALAHLLPFIEQQNVYNDIDFTKPMTDKANDKARKVQIKLYVSPQDPLQTVKEGVGATNYMFCAGSKPGLKDNDGVFAQDRTVNLGQITNGDGTSNTVMVAETLKGDGGTKAVNVQRQHVGLKKDALKGIKDEAGVKDFKDGKNIVGDRGASWMDGRFLQGTFTATRSLNDERPDVNCEGLGGLSALRSLNEKVIPVAWCDGHVSNVPVTIKLATWKALTTWNGGENVTPP